MRRVVVTGIGLITPIGIGKEEFWKNNKEGKVVYAICQNWKNSVLNLRLTVM